MMETLSCLYLDVAPARSLLDCGTDDVAEPLLHHLFGGHLPHLNIEHRINPRA